TTSQSIFNASTDLRNRTNTAGTSISVGNAEVQVNGATVSFSGPITNGSRTLTKTGNGALNISGTQTNTGSAAIIVSDGTLNMQSNGGTSLTITSNAATSFTGTHQLKQLTIGTTGTASAAASGTLILSASSTIDLGAATAGIVQFADSSAQTSSGATLNITNWSGAAGGGGAEQIKFDSSNSSLTPAQLAKVQFVNPASQAPGIY